jgi:hypothetical protein
MLNQRRAAVEAVRDTFLPAEAASDAAAIQAARCLATTLEMRATANLPIGTGLDAIALLSRGASQAVEARQSLIEAHAKLAEIPDQIGLATVGWGDSGGCPPVHASADAPAPLRSVA